MSDDGLKKQIERNVPSWTISLAVHAGLFLLLAAIPVVVHQVMMTDRVFSLQPPDVAGEAEAGVDNPGGWGDPTETADPSAQAVAASSQIVAMPPPDITALEAAVTDMALPELPSAQTAGGGDMSKGLVASLAATSEAGEAASGRSFGDLMGGTSSGFGTYIGRLRGSGLDVVLVLDATNSMAPYIKQSKQRLHEIVNVVTGLVPKARFGVVAYKDYGDDYGPEAVKSCKLAAKVDTVREFIDQIAAGGGGDIPEPIHEALKVAIDKRAMGWQPKRKSVIILVGDSPVHAMGRKKAFELAAKFAEDSKGTINVIDVGGTGDPNTVRNAVLPDLKEIATKGGGSAFLLTDGDVFWRHLIVSVFGERYKNDVNAIIERYVRGATDD